MISTLKLSRFKADVQYRLDIEDDKINRLKAYLSDLENSKSEISKEMSLQSEFSTIELIWVSRQQNRLRVG